MSKGHPASCVFIGYPMLWERDKVAVEEELGEKQLANGKLVDANLVIGEQEALNQIRSIKSFLQEAFGKNGKQKCVDVSKIWKGKNLCM